MKIRLRSRDVNGEHVETLDKEFTNVKGYGKGIIDYFNSTLRPGEKRRLFISAECEGFISDLLPIERAQHDGKAILALLKSKGRTKRRTLWTITYQTQDDIWRTPQGEFYKDDDFVGFIPLEG